MKYCDISLKISMIPLNNIQLNTMEKIVDISMGGGAKASSAPLWICHCFPLISVFFNFVIF